MKLRLIVDGQSVYPYEDLPVVADKSQEFVLVEFEFRNDWTEFEQRVAQFSQNNNTYSSILPDDNTVYLPAEIGAGICKISVFGAKSGEPDRATTKPYSLKVYESGLDDGATPAVPPTPDLYAQLLARILQTEANILMIQSVEAEAVSLPFGTPASAEVEIIDEIMTIRFGIPAGEPGALITTIAVMSQVDYDALAVKDPQTYYFILG